MSGRGPGPGSDGCVAVPQLRTESGSRLWGQQTADQGASLDAPGQTLPWQPTSFPSSIYITSTYFSYYVPGPFWAGESLWRKQTKPSRPHRADTLVWDSDNRQEKRVKEQYVGCCSEDGGRGRRMGSPLRRNLRRRRSQRRENRGRGSEAEGMASASILRQEGDGSGEDKQEGC